MALLKANTGIGITNPSEALHVIGNGLFVGIVSATSFIGNLSGTATSAINLVGGEQGSVPYQSSTNSTTFLSPGTPGRVLITAGGGQNPYWGLVSSAEGSFSGITIQDEGNVVGSALSISSLNFVGANITATGSGIAATITIANNLVGTALSISGISTFTNGPVLIGSGTSTGTASQPLQVTGGTYVSGNVGIGTTTPTSKLQVVGNVLVSGIVTATEFNGALTGNATSADKLFTPRTISLTGDIEGSVSFDGSTNVSIASTIQPNSVGLGTDTFGDYVKNITGTSNQITVTSGTGEGSTPTLSIPDQFTVPQDLTVLRDVQINRNLNVNGNITIGGTSATIFSQSLTVFDPDIVLGYRTDANGNDISTDNTANHGGIAIASTEGSPLVQLFIAGIEINPATYKKIMWFKEGTFAGLGTDAWLSNYAIGIGSTQFPTGTRLAAGSVQFTENDLAVVRNINSSGIISATSFVGSFEGNVTTATYATSAGIATYATNAGVSTNVIGGIGSITRLQVTGISTFTNGPVFIGAATSTGTSSQPLQVTGGAYVSGNLGIGTTNPTSTLQVQGTVSVSSTTTSAEFVGGGSDLRNLSGTHLVSYASASDISNSALSIAGINTYTQVGILTGSLAVNTYDYFGYSVATSADGKTIIVGAYNDEIGTTDTGVVYVYDRVGSSFNQVGILTGSLAGSLDYFGYSVATSADGKTIVVGALGDEIGAGTTDTGVVYVYDRVGNSFNQVGILTGSLAGAYDYFPRAVATSADGKTIVVGAPTDEIGANDGSGVVYVYDRVGSSFNQVGILTGSLAVDVNDYFGQSVATSADGKTIIVGAWQDELSGTGGYGLAYVYDRVGSSFNQVGILTGSLVATDYHFGNSVATSADGKTIIVGDDQATRDGGAGVVYVFDRVGNTFNRVGILTGSLAVDSGDAFGNSVATSADGKTIIVGAPGDGVGSTDAGVVYVFNRQGNSFNQVGILTGSLAVDSGDAFGSSVATSADGKTIVVGATNDELSGTTRYGLAYVFDQTRETYVYSGPTGNIGIGTTNPTSKLQVQGDVSIASTVGIGTVIDIVPYDTLNSGTLSFEGSAGQLFSITNNLTSGSIFSVNDVSGIPSIDVDANGTVSLVAYSGNVAIGSTGITGTSNQKLQVTGGGYVSGSLGIGTTNPSQSLHVQGNARVTGALYDGTNVAGSSGQILQTTGSAVQWINASTTNVGSANSIGINLDSTNASRYLTFVSTTSGNNLVYVDSDLLYNPSTNSLAINSTTFTGTASQTLQVTGGAYVSGNLGIGITNPTEKLDVRGNQVVRGILNVGSTDQSGTEILNIKQRGDSDGIRLYSGNNGAGGSVNPPFISFYRSIGEGLSPSARLRIQGYNPGWIGSNNDSDGFSLSSPNSSVNWIGGSSNAFASGSATVATGAVLVLLKGGDLSIGDEPSANNVPNDGTVRSGQKYGGTNVGGSNFTIQAGRGTGNSTDGGVDIKGNIIFQTPQLTTSGTTLQSYQTKLTIGRTITSFANSPVLVGTATSTGTASQTLQVTGGAYVSGNVGIGTTLPQYKLHVVGDFGATTKSFSIPHPTKPGLTLRHGSLEGAENGVYVRGKTTESIIPLPDYWTGLVDEESITVNLTPKNGKLHSVVGISSNTVEIECIGGEIDCYFMILGERKDVAKLVAEY